MFFRCVSSCRSDDIVVYPSLMAFTPSSSCKNSDELMSWLRTITDHFCTMEEWRGAKFPGRLSAPSNLISVSAGRKEVGLGEEGSVCACNFHAGGGGGGV